MDVALVAFPVGQRECFQAVWVFFFFFIFKLFVGIRTGGCLDEVFHCKEDFVEGGCLPKKHRATCWLMQMVSPAQCGILATDLGRPWHLLLP